MKRWLKKQQKIKSVKDNISYLESKIKEFKRKLEIEKDKLEREKDKLKILGSNLVEFNAVRSGDIVFDICGECYYWVPNAKKCIEYIPSLYLDDWTEDNNKKEYNFSEFIIEEDEGLLLVYENVFDCREAFKILKEKHELKYKENR